MSENAQNNAPPGSANARSAQRPKISVVLPMYNAAKFLPACLDSLLAQSMGDFEIVAVDDASTDATSEIVTGYAARDNRIRLTRHKENANSFATRLTALNLVEGEYIFCCDADDIVPPDGFALLLGKAELTGADVVHGRTLLLADGETRETAYWVEPFRAATGREFVLAMLRNRRGWNVWAKLFSRRAVERSLPFFSRGRHWFTLDDLLTSCLFALRADRYAALDRPVYHYRVPPVTHSTRSGGYEKWAGDSLGILTFLEETIGDSKDDVPLRDSVQGFMRDCITGLLTEASSSPEAFSIVEKKIRSTVAPSYIRWAEENGLLAFGSSGKGSKVQRIIGRMHSAVGRACERGVRESYLRLRTKLLFRRWEREYTAARMADGSSTKTLSE